MTLETFDFIALRSKLAPQQWLFLRLSPVLVRIHFGTNCRLESPGLSCSEEAWK
jgi:hypothetical protein